MFNYLWRFFYSIFFYLEIQQCFFAQLSIFITSLNLNTTRQTFSCLINNWEYLMRIFVLNNFLTELLKHDLRQISPSTSDSMLFSWSTAKLTTIPRGHTATFPYFQDSPTTRAIKWNGVDSSGMAARISFLPLPIIFSSLSLSLFLPPSLPPSLSLSLSLSLSIYLSIYLSHFFSFAKKYFFLHHDETRAGLPLLFNASTYRGWST